MAETVRKITEAMEAKEQEKPKTNHPQRKRFQDSLLKLNDTSCISENWALLHSPVLPWDVAIFGLQCSSCSNSSQELGPFVIHIDCSAWPNIFDRSMSGKSLIFVGTRCLCGFFPEELPGIVEARLVVPERFLTSWCQDVQAANGYKRKGDWSTFNHFQSALLLAVFLLNHVSWAQAQVWEYPAGCINDLSRLSPIRSAQHLDFSD